MTSTVVMRASESPSPLVVSHRDDLPWPATQHNIPCTFIIIPPSARLRWWLLVTRLPFVQLAHHALA